MPRLRVRICHRDVPAIRETGEKKIPSPQESERQKTQTTMISDPTTAMTPHQLELLALYASGYQLGQIAEMKFLSYIAVRKSLAAARERVGARSLTHLSVICLEFGVIAKDGDGYRPVQDERVIA